MDVPTSSLEFLIDCVIGDPLEIFRFQNKKNIEYDIRPKPKNQEILDHSMLLKSFDGTFDPVRTTLLINVVKGSSFLLSELSVKWYH